MPKLSINEIDYDVIDCTDKVVIFKIPAMDGKTYRGIFDALENVMKIIKETYNPKKVLAIPACIDFETMDVKEAIYKIDEYIKELHRIREDLL